MSLSLSLLQAVFQALLNGPNIGVLISAFYAKL